jgi:hypothetical protein
MNRHESLKSFILHFCHDLQKDVLVLMNDFDYGVPQHMSEGTKEA